MNNDDFFKKKCLFPENIRIRVFQCRVSVTQELTEEEIRGIFEGGVIKAVRVESHETPILDGKYQGEDERIEGLADYFSALKQIQAVAVWDGSK